jgi:methylmalonyl-CoA mutase
VNKFKLKNPEKLDVLIIDNKKVLEEQIKKLENVKKNRDEKKVKEALNELTSAAQNNTGNLLDLSIKASRARCTVG